MRQAPRLLLTASSQTLTHLSQQGGKLLIINTKKPHRLGPACQQAGLADRDTEIFPFLIEEKRNQHGSNRKLELMIVWGLT